MAADKSYLPLAGQDCCPTTAHTCKGGRTWCAHAHVDASQPCYPTSPHNRPPLRLLLLLSSSQAAAAAAGRVAPVCRRVAAPVQPFLSPSSQKAWDKNIGSSPTRGGTQLIDMALEWAEKRLQVCADFLKSLPAACSAPFSRHAPLSLASAAGDQKAPTFGSRVFGRAMRRSRPRPTGRDEEQAGRKAVRALFLRTPLPLEHRHPSFLSARLELLLQRREPQCLSHVMGANRLLVDACVFVRSSIQKLRPLKATPSTTLAKRRNQRKRRQSEAVFRHSAACGAAVLLTTPTQTLTKTKVSRSDV